MNKQTIPCAFITKGKQRVKQFNQTVYLNNGDEFEIELFNPTTNKVLAKIELNGKSMSSGIVLRPGERVFLERYLDTAKKFLFETYQVSGNSEAVKKAIEFNGKVNVKFYQEEISFDYDWPNIINDTNWYPNPTVTDPPYWYDLTGTFNYGTSGGQNVNHTFTCSNSFSPQQFKSPGVPVTELDQSRSFGGEMKRSAPRSKLSKSVETGRVEKGSHSNQKFKYVNEKFYSYHSWESEWKILPISQKVRTAKELNEVWCTNCGTRRRKDNHKFCPLCGTRYA